MNGGQCRVPTEISVCVCVRVCVCLEFLSEVLKSAPGASHVTALPLLREGRMLLRVRTRFRVRVCGLRTGTPRSS